MEQPPFPVVFDPAQRRRTRARALENRTADAMFLPDWAGRHLLDRLQDVRRDFSYALKIGTRDHIALPCPAVTMDLAGTPAIIAEEEFLPFAPHSFDLVFSALSLHTANDLPGALIQIRRALKPDGLFLAAMLGGETLHELRQCLQQAELDLSGGLSPRVAPFADKQQMGALLQRAGYALPVVDSDIVTVTYRDFSRLLRDLRGMGETNMMAARQKSFTARALFTRAEALYREMFADLDGQLRASFEIIFLLGWAPHDSQQKPLKPGSATARLADILHTDETKLGP